MGWVATTTALVVETVSRAGLITIEMAVLAFPTQARRMNSVADSMVSGDLNAMGTKGHKGDALLIWLKDGSGLLHSKGSELLLIDTQRKK